MQNQIKSIRFKNLFSYGNKWQEFSPEGICFITGHNKNNDRKNFTGKSNLLKVFPFALYGKVEGLNKSRVINWKNRGKSECYITIQKGKDEYIIHRGIKPDILAVTKNGKELPMTANKKDFQKQIEDEILQMDYQSFMQTVYADNSNESILNMSKPNKRQFLENIFDLHYYTDLRNKANKKNSAIESKISTLKTVISETQQRIQDAKKLQDNYLQEKQNLPNSSNKLQNKQRFVEEHEDTYKDALKEIDDIEAQIQSLNNDLNALDVTKTKIKYKIKELSNKHIVKEQTLDNVDDVKQKVSQKNKSIESKQADIKSYKKELDDFESDLEQQKEVIIEELAELKANFKHAEHQYKEADKKVANKLTDAKCPTCLQDVDHQLIEDSLNQDKLKWETKKNNVNKQVDVKQKHLSEVKKSINDRQGIESGIETLEEGVKADEEEVTMLHDKISEIEEKQMLMERSKKYKKVIGELTKLFESHLNKHKEIQKQIKDNEPRLSDNKAIKKEHEELKVEIDKLKVSVDSENQQKKKLEQWITDAKQKQDQLLDQIESDEKKIKSMHNIKDYIDYIKDICSDDKGRAYSISQKVPLLNQRTNHYLTKTDVQYYIKLNNWLDAEIKGPGIKNCVYENLSGAERISLDRSLQFALHDINKLQSPSYYDLMILDEIIGSNSLDAQGIENMINIIDTKQKEDKSNILLVSHDENVKEAEGLIDSYYVVEFDGSYSHIKKV